MLLLFFISSKMKITIKNMHRNNQDNNKQTIKKCLTLAECGETHSLRKNNSLRLSISDNVSVIPRHARTMSVLDLSIKYCIYLAQNLRVTSSICISRDAIFDHSSHPYKPRGKHRLKCFNYGERVYIGRVKS